MSDPAYNWEIGMKMVGRWIAAGAGIPIANVKWVGQGGQPPPTPWISAKLMTTRGFGTPERTSGDNPLELADDIVDDVDATANTLTVTAHAYGDEPYSEDDAAIRAVGPIRFTTTGVLPSPLALATDYWLIIVDENTVKVAASRAAAVAASPTAIDIVDDGSGVHTIVDTAATRRVLEEVKIVDVGHRVAVLSLQCFADDAIYGSRGQAILERLRASYRLPGQMDRMRGARLAVANFGDCTNVGGSASSAAALEPRAVVEVTLNYVDGAQELATTIESFELNLLIDLDEDGDDDVDETFTVTRPP